MDLKKGEMFIYWAKGEYVGVRTITNENNSDEVIKGRELMTPGIFGVISEIPGYAWIITAGNRAYLYSGLPGDGLTVAKKHIEQLPINAGCTVRTHKIVG